MFTLNRIAQTEGLKWETDFNALGTISEEVTKVLDLLSLKTKKKWILKRELEKVRCQQEYQKPREC